MSWNTSGCIVYIEELLYGYQPDCFTLCCVLKINVASDGINKYKYDIHKKYYFYCTSLFVHISLIALDNDVIAFSIISVIKTRRKLVKSVKTKKKKNVPLMFPSL